MKHFADNSAKPQRERIPADVWPLLEAVCEDCLTPEQARRLERHVLADASIRRLYVEYLTLHGNLHWDAALPDAEMSGDSLPVPADSAENTRDESGTVDENKTVVVPARQKKEGRSNPRTTGLFSRRWTGWLLTTLAASLLLVVGAMAHRLFLAAARQHSSPASASAGLAASPSQPAKSGTPASAKSPQGRNRSTVQQSAGKKPATKSSVAGGKSRRPLQLPDAAPRLPRPENPHPAAVVAARPRTPAVAIPAGGSSLESVVAFIDSRLQHHWDLEGVRPSSVADDYEWVRRVYLDLIGRIPTVQEVERFVRDANPHKRRNLIEQLLQEPQYVRHWSTVWSNLLVGRKPSRDVNKGALERFLRDSFARNRSWKKIVADLVSAEGPVDENGAANFLVAHLNNQAVPATAVTARLFLGMQVQCTQCHNHPFNNWKQNQFWELNSFFKQTKTVRRKNRADGKSSTVLVNRPVGGPTYYPTRNELIRVVFPKFGNSRIRADASVNRRAELARLMFEDEKQQVARAFVNRMWAQFFGYGFTRPVDDMGPHNPPTHPELLGRLTEEFVASGYDIKRLIRWICNSRAYQLSSRFNETNTVDAPATGNLPLFSRMYVKSMTAEQLYDSLLTATRGKRLSPRQWEEARHRRNEWLQQFVYAHQTEENDESTTFDGTIPQALMMMNGALIHESLQSEGNTFLHDVLSAPLSDTARIRKLSLAALSREPTPAERAAVRRILNRKVPRAARLQHRRQVLQDLFWAYLNSSEFLLIH